MTTLEHKTRRVAVFALRGFLGLALLIVLFQYVSLDELLDSWRKARFDYLSMAVLLAGANLSIQILKWRYFVRLIDPKCTSMEALASFMFGMALGTVTPGQIGEFGGRALRHNSMKAGAIVGLTLIDRLQMICVLGIAGIVSLPFLLGWGSTRSILIIAPSCSILLLLFFNPRIVPAMIARLDLKVLQRPAVEDFVSAVEAFRMPQLIRSFLFSAVFYLVVCLQMFLLLNAFAEVGFLDAFSGFACMMLLKALLPISLGDLGIREASSVYFYSLLGIAPATALSASLLLFVINVLAPSIVGLAFIPKLSNK